MRQRFVGLILLLGLVFATAPARAEIGLINPREEPDVTLDEAEAEKLARLQDVTFPNLLSEVSPDDRSILQLAAQPDAPPLAFLDVQTGALRPVDEAALEWSPLTEIGWRDARTAVYVSGNSRTGPVLISLDRDTGSVMTRTLELPGFPLSLAPNGSRVIVGFSSEIEEQSRRAMPESPFKLEIKRTLFDRVGPATFDAEKPLLKFAINAVTYVAVDLNSGEASELVTVPQGSAIVGGGWMSDGSKLALIRTTVPNVGREGNLLSEATTQDGLGNLPPDQNPFFQNNVVDTFDFARRDYRLASLKARDGNGYTFGRIDWSPDGKTLMAQMQRPSQLEGRRYPVYQAADRSVVRFYDANLQPLNTLDRPEIEAPYTALPIFVSPDEVFFNAPYGLSYRLYYYNRVSGEFRHIPAWEGTYYQVRSTRQSRQLIFNFSAFQHPYEVYRINWDGSELRALTALNREVMEVNQVRADKVNFTLRGGAQRSGYLVQPVGAPFPPRNVPMVVWQEGGPGGTITNQWGGIVESPFNLLPNFGIAVLVAPLPGREGWGPKFLNDLANGRNFGAIDIDEGAAIVQQMIAMGYTASDKVGVTGCSYGGYYASQSITRHPTLYAAANSQCTLLDLFAEWQSGYTGFLSYLEGRAPTADPEEYTRDSPLYNAVRVRTPLLLFAGTNDFLPAKFSANFHDQIAAGKWPVELLLFADEGHGLSQPTSQFVAGQAQINWFREYLAE